MNEEIEKRIEDALKTSDPETELTNLVKELKTKGWSQFKTYDVFETHMFSLQAIGREKDSDIVGEVVTDIYGWCGENTKLFGRTMSNEEIRKYREENLKYQIET